MYEVRTVHISRVPSSSSSSSGGAVFRYQDRTDVDLLATDFPTGEAVGPGVLLASLDRADYLPPPAAATAPTDVAHMSIGPPENAG